MNKILLSMLAAGAVFSAAATEPNRVIIEPAAGTTLAYRTDNIKEIRFATVEGTIEAVAKVLKVGEIGAAEAVTVSVTKSEGCFYYKYVLVPEAVVAGYDDNILAAYIDQNSPEVMYEGFESAALQGVTLDANTNYLFATLAFDGYGAACQVSRAPFSTPSATLVGNPQCTYEVDKTGLFTAEITVTPNADVAGWAACMFEEGQMQRDFEQFAPMFGFANYGQMVKMWGTPHTGKDTVVLKQLAPNTSYELAIQAWDINNNFAPLTMAQFATKNQGGSGEAYAEVELGDYTMTDGWGEDNETRPSQYITFIPNDQTMRYRFGVYLKSQYDTDPDMYKNDVASEEPMPNMANWWFYDELTTDFQINPSVEYVVITAAQNADHEWGDVKVYEYTTPAETMGMPAVKTLGLNEVTPRISAKQGTAGDKSHGMMRLVIK